MDVRSAVRGPASLLTEGDSMGDVPAILEFEGLTAGYGRSIVLRDLSFSAPAGKVVVLLGANGVGKTTTLRVAAGLVRPSSGRVLLDGKDVTRVAPHDRAHAGLCLIPEGRGIFRSLSVADNLRMHQPPWVRSGDQLAAALDAFPILARRRHQLAGSMSGGEQQILALARAWLCSPKLVMVDEASMGLAPKIVDVVFDALKVLADRGTALLVVEQYVKRALALADLALVMNKTGIAFFGPPSELDEDELVESYMGGQSSSKLPPRG